MTRLNFHTFAFLDVETTGLSPWFGDRICEIAILRCDGETIVETFDTLLNPERPLSPGAARVNGLKDADLVDAPKFADIAEQVIMLIQNAVIVCHNVPFDLGFLSSELERVNKYLPTTLVLDTLEVARQYFDFDSNSLQSIAHDLEIQVSGAHRALNDVLTTRELLRYFTRNLQDTEVEHLIAAYYPPVIEEALQSKKRLFIRYVDRKGAVSERWVSPVQVRALNDYLYLVAYCHLRDEERNFRLDRIEYMSVEE